MPSGYKQGVRKKIVLDAYRDGKTIQQLVREGMTYNSVFNACLRSKIKLKSETNHSGWGVVKSAVIDAEKNNLTVEQVCKNNGFRRKTVTSCLNRLKIKLKPDGEKQIIQNA